MKNSSRWDQFWNFVIKNIIVEVLVAIVAGIIVAIVVKEGRFAPSATPPPVPAPISVTTAPSVLQNGNNTAANPLVGDWSGIIKSPDGSFSTTLNLFFFAKL